MKTSKKQANRIYDIYRNLDNGPLRRELHQLEKEVLFEGKIISDKIEKRLKEIEDAHGIKRPIKIILCDGHGTIFSGKR